MILSSRFGAFILAFSLIILSASCGREASSNLASNSPTELSPGTFDPSCTAETISQKIACIKGVKIVSLQHDSRRNVDVYELTFPQPVDHTTIATSANWFDQRVVLHDRGESEPMVLQTSGYSIFGVADSELSRMFATNQLQIEHRYFQNSKPQTGPLNWELLTVKQAADDFHRITVAFKNIYKKAWVNTGASKGGMTSIFHRRFYPDDVDATVAYVAPLSLSSWDDRYIGFVDQVGGEGLKSCRTAMINLQKSLLSHRDEILPLISGSFEVVGAKEYAFEHTVIEMPFGFFQYQDAATLCPQIPDANASAQVLYTFMNRVYSVNDNFDDETLKTFSPYFFQSARELGYPGARLNHIVSQLQHLDTYTIESFMPQDVTTYYHPESMQDIDQWVREESSKIIYIYGEFDPWSAAMFPLRSEADTYRYVSPKGTHGSKLATLSPSDRTVAVAKLKTWFAKNPITEVTAKNKKHTAPLLEDLQIEFMRKKTL